MTTGFAEFGDYRLFYKIQGSGPRILFISGTNSDTRHAPTIYDVPGIEKFEVLNFDHRGMGQSSVPENTLELEEYADDVAKLIEHIGWESATVVGVSFGGMIAQHFALKHPEKVDKLVLCCTSSGGEGGSSYPLHELTCTTAADYASIIMKVMNVQHTDAWQEANPASAKKNYEFYLKGAEDSYGSQERRDALKRQFDSRSRHNVYDRLFALNMPALVACGKFDGVAPLENSENLAEQIPNSELKVYNGGHLFLREDAKAWPDILEFVKR